jgi:hypothetical protein
MKKVEKPARITYLSLGGSEIDGRRRREDSTVQSSHGHFFTFPKTN